MERAGSVNRISKVKKPSVPAGFITNWKRFLSLIESLTDTQITLLLNVDNGFKTVDPRKDMPVEKLQVVHGLLEEIYNFEENGLYERLSGNKKLENHHLNCYPVFWPDNELFATLVIDSGMTSYDLDKHLFDLADSIKSDIRSLLSIKRKEKLISDLRFDKAKARALFSSIPVGILTLKKNGKIKTVNTAVLKMFGYTAIEMQKLKFEDLIDKIDNAHKDKKIYNTTGLHTLGPGDNIMGIRKDGERFPVKLEISYGVNFTQVETIVAIEDLKTCKVFQDELLKKSDELEKQISQQAKYMVGVERQAAFGQLVQGIVHNIKSPLAVVSMSTEHMKENHSEGLEIKPKLFDSIIDAADKINSIVMSMLTRSREDKEKEIKTTDVNELIKEELEFLEANSEFKHKVKKEITLSEKPLYVEIIPSELSQVFENLINNSLDAMYGQEEKKLSIFTLREGQAILIGVEDNGPGIDAEIQENIFDPFFTTKPKKRNEGDNKSPIGTGLGLWMCRSIVESYKGTITLSSEKGIGTAFTVVLPVSEVANREK